MLQFILSVQMGNHKTFGVVIDNFRYQLDIKRRFVSKSMLGTVVVIKSMKYDGYTYSQITTFMVCSNTRRTMKRKKSLWFKVHCINSQAVTHDRIMYHISPYTLYITTSKCAWTKSNLCMERKCYYICDELIHLWYVATFTKTHGARKCYNSP